jgi:hypothetical protein
VLLHITVSIIVPSLFWRWRLATRVSTVVVVVLSLFSFIIRRGRIPAGSLSMLWMLLWCMMVRMMLWWIPKSRFWTVSASAVEGCGCGTGGIYTTEAMVHVSLGGHFGSRRRRSAPVMRMVIMRWWWVRLSSGWGRALSVMGRSRVW